MASSIPRTGSCSCSQHRLDESYLPSTSGRSRTAVRVSANMPPMYATSPIPLRPNKQGVVKGATTTATPRLTPERVMQRLAEVQHETSLKHYAAFYSSELGGIVTQPGYMVIHMDDHMVHRGDAVFDTVLLVNGYLYQLDEHMQRFNSSAGLAGLPLPMAEERVRRVLLDTAAASMKMNGMLTFWLSRGRGSFGLCDSSGPTLYALLSTEVAYPDIDRNGGFSAVSSPVDPQPFYFSAMKNTSYIQNSVCQLEAMSRGADMGVFVDGEGYVLYGPDCSIAILTRDNVLVVPPDEAGLAGMAANNVAELVLKYAEGDELPIESVERRTFTVPELQAAEEAFAINSSMGVVGISHFDGQWIGSHEFLEQAGPVSLALNEMLVVDRQPQPGSTKHTEVPYGYMTGMRSQLK